MQSVRDHLIALNRANEKKINTKKNKSKNDGHKKIVHKSYELAQYANDSSWESIAPIQQLSWIGLPKKPEFVVRTRSIKLCQMVFFVIH